MSSTVAEQKSANQPSVEVAAVATAATTTASATPTPAPTPEPKKQQVLTPAPIPTSSPWKATSTEIPVTILDNSSNNNTSKRTSPIVKHNSSNTKWVPIDASIVISGSKKSHHHKNNKNNNNSSNNSKRSNNNRSNSNRKSNTGSKKHHSKPNQTQDQAESTSNSTADNNAESIKSSTATEGSNEQSESQDSQIEQPQPQTAKKSHSHNHHHHNHHNNANSNNRKHNNNTNGQQQRRQHHAGNGNGHYKSRQNPRFNNRSRFNNQNANNQFTQYYPIQPVMMSVNNIARQLEYYFSAENLEKDTYLRNQLSNEGYAPLSLISKFYRIVNMSFGGDSNLIMAALREIVANPNATIDVSVGTPHTVEPTPVESTESTNEKPIENSASVPPTHSVLSKYFIRSKEFEKWAPKEPKESEFVVEKILVGDVLDEFIIPMISSPSPIEQATTESTEQAKETLTSAPTSNEPEVDTATATINPTTEEK